MQLAREISSLENFATCETRKSVTPHVALQKLLYCKEAGTKVLAVAVI